MDDVFISYARRDGRAFAERLSADLRRAGHRVWIDLESISGAALFDVAIEEGIRGAVHVLAVLTARALEEDSVCRDEIVFALQERKPITPIRIDPGESLRPSLLLARRQWIDFSGDYEAGLQRLLGALEPAQTRGPEPRPVAPEPEPMDVALEVARHAAAFSGRAWLDRTIDDLLEAKDRPLIVIVAEPGVGKSAYAAHLAASRSDIAAAHFVSAQIGRTTSPQWFVRSLVQQLRARIPDYARRLDSTRPPVDEGDPHTQFRDLITLPLSRVRLEERLVVVVDALDEAVKADQVDLLDLLATHVADLPAEIRVVATSRPDASVISRLPDAHVVPLDPADERNRGDLESWVRSRMDGLARAGHGASDEVASRVVQEAEGNFLVARCLLADPASTGTRGGGIGGYYAAEFRRRWPDRERYAREVLPILQVLSVAREPLSLSAIGRLAGVPDETASVRLPEVSRLLRADAEGAEERYSIFHRSLADWLHVRERSGAFWCSAPKSHARFAEALCALDAPGPELARYERDWLSFHCVEGGLHALALSRIDEEFLARKLDAVGYGVLEDVTQLARAMLHVRDPHAISSAVDGLARLSRRVPPDLVHDMRTAITGTRRPYDPSGASPVEVPAVRDLDVWAAVIPKGDVGADFVEAVTSGDTLTLAMGDAPGSGIFGAIQARLASSALRSLLEGTGTLTASVRALEKFLSQHEFFKALSLMCATVQGSDGLCSLLAVGHPSPALWTSRLARWDLIPVSGLPLSTGIQVPRPASPVALRLERGDILVLISDGICEPHRLDGTEFGYRFLSTLGAPDGLSAREIGERIVRAWRNHERPDERLDDASLAVVVRRGGGEAPG